ncbi:hypothetical protein PAPYR_9495 [Paratrimastix pyriformis]|uniref:Uncharacterized protein n=1 Tax=Paratrimastix pyriformis TaxID=342808 RepID=A0ABQ8U899_9EUKA|nr:hypothetical protein PAPYR_9495 [Paratrimastix pyriformis]
MQAGTVDCHALPAASLQLMSTSTASLRIVQLSSPSPFGEETLFRVAFPATMSETPRGIIVDFSRVPKPPTITLRLVADDLTRWSLRPPVPAGRLDEVISGAEFGEDGGDEAVSPAQVLGKLLSCPEVVGQPSAIGPLLGAVAALSGELPQAAVHLARVVVAPLVGLLISNPEMDPALLQLLAGAIANLAETGRCPRDELAQAGLAEALVQQLTARPTMVATNPALAQELLRVIVSLAKIPECQPSLVQAGAAGALAKQLAATSHSMIAAHPILAGVVILAMAHLAATDFQPLSMQLTDALVQRLITDPTMSTDNPVLAWEYIWAISNLSQNPACLPALMQAGTATALVGQIVSNPTMAIDHPRLAQEFVQIIDTLNHYLECRPALAEAGVADALATLLGSNPTMATDCPDLAEQILQVAINLTRTIPEIRGLLMPHYVRADSLLWGWFNKKPCLRESVTERLFKQIATLGSPRFSHVDGVVVLRAPLPAAAPIPAQTPEAIGTPFNLLERLPTELLGSLCGSSADPLRTYLTLIGLSHRLRAALRGTLLEMAFISDPDMPTDEAPLPTTDALAAIVGPCEGLRRLVLPQAPLDELRNPVVRLPDYSRGPPARRRGRALPPKWDQAPDSSRAQIPPWVDEAFAGHDQLETLEVLMTGRLQPLMPSILGHLPGLKYLHVDTSEASGYIDLTPIAPWLTHLTDSGSALEYSAPVLRKLHELKLPRQLRDVGTATLTTSKNTLRSLSFTVSEFDVERIVASLAAMPHLTRLELVSDPATCLDLCAALPDMLPSLQHLSLRLENDELLDGAPPLIQIRSPRLCTLRLTGEPTFGTEPGQTALVLDCPVLEELALSATIFSHLELRCPRLRSLEGPALDPAQSHLQSGASNLACLVLHPPSFQDDFVSTWLAAAPRLRAFRSDALCLAHAALWASRTLTWLRVRLPVEAFPLRLPVQLARLEVDIDCCSDLRGSGLTRGDELAVAGPGLRVLTMRRGPPDCRLMLNCPALEVLRLEMPPLRAFGLADGAAPPPLRSLDIGGEQCSDLADTFIDSLLRHGAQLRHLSLPALSDCSVWPQLAAALSRLPRLTILGVWRRDGVLALTCPSLRLCCLRGQGGPVVLNCPALDTIRDTL